MASTCLSVCFGIFLTISLLLYIAELVLNGIYVYNVFCDETRKPWFTPMVGILLLPTVVVQLVSVILLLGKRGDYLTCCRLFGIAVLHVLQLGFFWRHISLFRETDPAWKTKELSDLSLLHVLHTFTSMLPLLFIQSFMILHYDVTDSVSIATIVVTFIASCWFIASFRRHHNIDAIDDLLLTWPGTIFRLLWRAGELLSRIISLAVFTSIYYYWIFLILGLHGLTMLVCLCTSVLGMIEKSGLNSCNKLFLGIIMAYMYTVCFVNTSSENTVFRYTLFYIIMFLENAVLTAVWYMQADQSDGGTKVNSIVFISACSFFIGIISLIVYYKFFHVRTTSDSDKGHVCDADGCINCRLSLCSKHNIKLQRPFSAGWISQYQQALLNGNYYRNILQDSLIDSEFESVSCQLNSSGEHWQIRDSELESLSNNKPYMSLTASGSYAHKRFFDSNTDITGDLDSEDSSISSLEYHQRMHDTDGSVCSQCSVNVARSAVSSTTQLLTDSWDSLLKDYGSVGCNNKHNQTKKVDILASLIRPDIDHADSGLLSDGYTTDHTFDSYQLPVTVLAKKRGREYRRERLEPAYSTASDSTDCTICAFMKQNPPTPVGRRRHLYAQEKIPEERDWDSDRMDRLSPNYKGHVSDKIYSKNISRRQKSPKKYKDAKHRSKSHDSGLKGRRRNKTDMETVLETFTLNPVKSVPENRLSPPAIRITLYDDQKNGRRPMKSETRDLKNTKLSVNNEPRTLVNVSEAIATRDKHRKSSQLTYHIDSGNTSRDKLRKSPKMTYHSDSGDSAFPRHTPVGSYFAATDEDAEGVSQSSLEMII